MHISFALFADAANLSQEGKLNVLGIFDALQVGGFPTIHPRAHFVVRLKGTNDDAGKHALTFRWSNPRGEQLWSSTGELVLERGPVPSPSGEMDLPVVAVIDLPLDEPGQYMMRVDLDDTMITDVPLIVHGPISKPPTLGLVS